MVGAVPKERKARMAVSWSIRPFLSLSYLFIIYSLYYFTGFLSSQGDLPAELLALLAAIIELKRNPTSSLTLKWVLRQSFSLATLKHRLFWRIFLNSGSTFWVLFSLSMLTGLLFSSHNGYIPCRMYVSSLVVFSKRSILSRRQVPLWKIWY